MKKQLTDKDFDQKLLGDLVNSTPMREHRYKCAETGEYFESHRLYFVPDPYGGNYYHGEWLRDSGYDTSELYSLDEVIYYFNAIGNPVYT